MKDIFLACVFAFSFLTILPFPGLGKISFTKKSIILSPVFFPFVGFFYGYIVYLSARLLSDSIIMIEVQALIILAIPYLLNKFLHFDGLCDTADAFFADKTKEERLVILKDSGIGSFALGSVFFYMLLKFFLVKYFITIKGLIPYLVIIFIFSRYAMVLMSFISKYPRNSGTARHIIGQITGGIFLMTTAVLITISFFVMIATDIFSYRNIIIMLIVIIATVLFLLLFRSYSYKKIGGATGDVLGASSELTELVLLITISIAHRVIVI